MLLSMLLGAVIGGILGLTGAGGGILTVPALVTSMGWPMQLATPVALIAISGSAAIGAIDAFRKRLVRYRAAIAMAIAGIPMTIVGTQIAGNLSQRRLMLGFCCVMLLVACRLLHGALTGDRHDGRAASCMAHVSPITGRFIWALPTWIALLGTGAVTGLMTGMLGVGGGFIIVPIMRRLTDLAMHGVVATSLLVIARVGAGGVMVMMMRRAVIPLQFVMWFAASTGIGMVAGRALSRRLDARQVQILFALVLLCVSVALMVKVIYFE